MNTKYYILIIIAAILSALSPYFAKKFAIEKKWHYILFSIIISLSLIYLYVHLFSISNLGKTYTIIKYLAVILVFVMGYFTFKEKINIKNIIGLILGMIGIYLLSG